MNASVHLLRRGLAATVHLRTEVPAEHPSAGVLGTERMGAGTVVAPYGLVLTAHYLMIGARSVEVSLPEGNAIPGQVVGIDYIAGVAAVRLSERVATGLSIRPAGPDLIGEEAFLVASVGDGRRVSNGVVTSVGPFEAFWEYLLDNAITTSAASPGLGGGPLIDARARMIGVVSLSLAEVGKFTLAVPASEGIPMLDEIARTGTYTARVRRAWLGLTCYPVASQVVVAAALPDSPVETAGLGSGDIIVAIDGEDVGDRRELYTRIWRRRPGDTLQLRVRRGSELLELEVTATSIEDFFGEE